MSEAETVNMPTKKEAHAQWVRDVLVNVTYPGYEFIVKSGERTHIQAKFVAGDVKAGQPALQYTRKWYISLDATRSEVVQTALKCVLTSVEHEARERFTYRGRAIFGPHLNVDELVRMFGSSMAMDAR